MLPASEPATVTVVDPDPWPLRHLELRTPRLSLRPDDDAGLHELAVLAARGVHPVDEMPFLHPWTDRPVDELVRGTLQHHWTSRGALTPAGWSVHFLVRRDGTVIGTQSLTAADFAVTKEVATGSWLGREHQRSGYGTEMRAAVLLFAFDHLGATAARSGAFTDNVASHGVSERLGYQRDGSHTRVRRGKPASEVRYRLDARELVRPQWSMELSGFGDACRALLGAHADPSP